MSSMTQRRNARAAHWMPEWLEPHGSSRTDFSESSQAMQSLPLEPREFSWRQTFRRLLRLATLAIAGTTAIFALLIIGYRFINPPASTLMLGQLLSGGKVEQQWMPIDEISPNLVKAVVMSEDAQFCQHWGVDWTAIRQSIKVADQRGPRGASTITMQTAKNLFLWPQRSYIRKVVELPLSYAIDMAWSKRRMLEIYLNIAEWGPGIFGAEAAAQYHFGRSAAKLSANQAALLAASLPNPFRRKAGTPGPRTRQLAARVQKRIGAAEAYAACVL